MNTIPAEYYLILSAILFSLGILGVLLRRNALVVFMSLELMFNAGNLAFITFARMYQTISAQVVVFFVMTVAAAEVAIGLALMVEIFRTKRSIDIDQMNSLKG
ncbi:MAG TPA: NADH-quinone oxidoreductase subunit NuoK [Anaerolinea thermolimosa]|jgi:NADH-quinone oxidoreductase subunit K|uniref:NADH-quinone oxidoreductase subunit K n=1 Tax=Anaerolinea thermolimosa TaxID=229919 RepID=A0A3D1JLV0_9CHLR|nr:NADH-quinone oxidoreductase subunit NuoK [Anaerolinea thermolimosa]GAP07396.1 NADH dehydrogenase subunit K [Anaerolinea thermolimosa]HCE18636.1 NADH-quinone oxidoreductase subunit NuoK [Anaerolinea thermolimosa]